MVATSKVRFLWTVLLAAASVFTGVVCSPVAARTHGGVAAAITPTLVAGTGWTGLIAQPAAVGNSGDYGFTHKVIAVWDAPQYQTITGQYTIYIDAFHDVTSAEATAGLASSIDHGSCSLDNGPFFDVFNFTINPADGRSELAWLLDATLVTDAFREVRCIIYPKTGVPTVLQGTFRGANNVTTGSITAGAMTVPSATLPVPWSITGAGVPAGTFATVNLGSGSYTLNNSGFSVTS
jgi:hypothetical protein